ncbi:MAG: DUF4139 domain-containing protein [Crocinitomicaceae bacterium]
MKQLIFFFSLILSARLVGQEIHEHRIESEIKDVTVFLTGGEIHRQASVPIKKGRNKLVFTKISTVADNKSIQFSSEQPINLVSVSSEIDYLNIVEQNPHIKTIKDSIDILQNSINGLINTQSAYQAEKQILDQNRSIKGQQANLTVEELSAMATFYRKKTLEINNALTELDQDISKQNLQKMRYQNQLTELNYKETVKSNQIIILVDAEANQTMDFDLRYVVSNCGWQANYDLMTNNITEKINLKYKAKVYNNTGNDWKGVQLFLSTSDPNITASAPELKPWFLNQWSMKNEVNDDYEGGYVVPQNRAFTKYYQNSAPQMNQNLDGLSFDQGFANNGNASNAEANIRFQNIEVSQLSTTFEIEKDYSIPSDAKPYLVEITAYELDAIYSHKAVPKLDKDAFLLANIVGWEQLDLVPGPTRVYYADAFVGQSYINTSNVQDTLRLSFGRDTKIPVTRKLVKEYSDKKVVGSNRKDTYTYKIIAKNNRDIPVRLNLYDQIPISQDSDISVTINEISDADYNETTGKLTWLLNLQPGESKSYSLSFTIKYPKDRQIRVKKYRTISAPSF